MLTKLLVASTLSAGLVATLAFAVAPARASTPHCASKAEFRAVANGWTITRVAHRFDVPGRQTYFDSGTPARDIPAYQSRVYHPCPDDSGAWLSFEKEPGTKWRLTSKSAYWGA